MIRDMSLQPDSEAALHRPLLRGLESESQKANIDLVDLTDFDVQIALSENQGVELYEVLRIVTLFMIESFKSCFQGDADNLAEFDTIILLERTRRRQLLLFGIERQLNGTC